MASRQERMQQRLRGVLRREVKDVDFGLTFPTKLKSKPQPVSRSPEPTLSPQVTFIQGDVIRDPILLSSITPVNQASVIHDVDTPGVSGEYLNTVRSADANTSKKRRTLIENEEILITSKSQKKIQRKNIPHNSQLKDDSKSNSVSANILPNESSESIVRLSYRKDIPEVEIKNLKSQKLGRTPRRSQGIQLVTESPTNAPGSGQRIQLDEPVPSELNAQSNIKRRSNGSVSSLSLKSRKGKKDRNEGKNQSSSPLKEKNIMIHALQTNDYDDDDEMNEFTPARSLLHDHKVGSDSPELGCSSVGKDKQEVTNAIEDASATKILASYEKQRHERLRHDSPDLDLPSIEPAKKKQRLLKRRSYISSPLENKNNTSIIKTKKSKKKKIKMRSRSSIPITVHRLATPINFEVEDIEGNDDKISKAPMQHLKRRNVNWIDILAKACEEIIDSRTSALKMRVDEYEDMATRRDSKTKWQAVKAFGRELQNQLLEYTLDLDNAHSLERRLREEQKEKLHLREEILRVRAEREEVAIQIDEIREQHNKAEEQNMKLSNLNNAVQNLELTMDIARDDIRKEGNCSSSHSIDSSEIHHSHRDNDVLDFARMQVFLKIIANDVTTQRSSSMGGLLSHIKDFNLFLERSATILERRSMA